MRRYIVRTFEFGFYNTYHVSAKNIQHAVFHVTSNFTRPFSMVTEVMDEETEKRLWYFSSYHFKDIFNEYMEKLEEVE